MDKPTEYAIKIQTHLSELFDNDSDCDNHIDMNEFEESDNYKAFIYALSTLVPCNLHNKFTQGNEDHLSFNHVMNHLVFEYSQLKSK